METKNQPSDVLDRFEKGIVKKMGLARAGT
jgi:hypothetical protein